MATRNQRSAAKAACHGADANAGRGGVLLPAAPGAQLWSFNGFTKRVRCIASCIDPRTRKTIVLAGSDDATLRAVSATTGEQLWNFTGFSNDVGCVACYIDPATKKPVVVAGSWDATLKAICGTTGEQLWEFTRFTHPVGCVATCVDPKTKEPIVIAGSYDMTVRAINGTTELQLWSFDRFTNWVNCIVSYVDPTTNEPIVIAGEDRVYGKAGTVKAIRSTAGKQRWSFRRFSHEVSCLASYIDPQTSRPVVLAGSWDDTLRAICGTTGDQLWNFTGFCNSVHCVDSFIDPETEEPIVIAGSGDSTLRAIRGATGVQIWSFTAFSASVKCVVSFVDPRTKERIVLAGDGGAYGRSGTIRAIRGTTGEQLWNFTGFTHWVNCVAVNVDPITNTAIVLAGSEDKTLRAISPHFDAAPAATVVSTATQKPPGRTSGVRERRAENSTSADAGPVRRAEGSGRERSRSRRRGGSVDPAVQHDEVDDSDGWRISGTRRRGWYHVARCPSR